MDLSNSDASGSLSSGKYKIHVQASEQCMVGGFIGTTLYENLHFVRVNEAIATIHPITVQYENLYQNDGLLLLLLSTGGTPICFHTRPSGKTYSDYYCKCVFWINEPLPGIDSR